MPIRDYPAGEGCRIQISDAVGRVSTVWRVFSGKKAPDFFVVPMMLGGALKVSLHASGSWQVGFTKEYQNKVGAMDLRHWEI